jgi:hypothetical protein
MRLRSPKTNAEFVRAGRSLGADRSPSPGKQLGEYRVRLRLGLLGAYVDREDPEKPGRRRPTWAVYPKEGDRPVDPEDLRSLAARRDLFFDGHFTY